MKTLNLLTLYICLISQTATFAQSEKSVVFEYAVKEIVRDICLKQRIQGVSLAIILADGTVYNHVIGIGRKGESISNATLFFAGNSTELYLATLTLLLQEKGIIDLDTPIRQYIKSWTFIDEAVTLRQLLIHTSAFGTK